MTLLCCLAMEGIVGTAAHLLIPERHGIRVLLSASTYCLANIGSLTQWIAL